MCMHPKVTLPAPFPRSTECRIGASRCRIGRNRHGACPLWSTRGCATLDETCLGHYTLPTTWMGARADPGEKVMRRRLVRAGRSGAVVVLPSGDDAIDIGLGWRCR